MYPNDYNEIRIAIEQTEVFCSWLSGLKDLRAKARIAARLRMAESGHLGDCKPVGGGVLEMRIDYGPGYRVYFARHQEVLMIMLCGGDKSTQGKDIKRARELMQKLELGT